jgi:hypothetical protein
VQAYTDHVSPVLGRAISESKGAGISALLLPSSRELRGGPQMTQCYAAAACRVYLRVAPATHRRVNVQGVNTKLADGVNITNITCGSYYRLRSQYGRGPCYPVWSSTVEFVNRSVQARQLPFSGLNAWIWLLAISQG